MTVLRNSFGETEKRSLICTSISLITTAIVSAITIYYLFSDFNSAYNSLVVPVSSLLGAVFLTLNGILKKAIL